MKMAANKLIKNLLSFVILVVEYYVWPQKAFDWDFAMEDNDVGETTKKIH